MNFLRTAWAGGFGESSAPEAIESGSGMSSSSSSPPSGISSKVSPTGISPGMDYCRDDGKDRVLWVSKDQDLTPLSPEAKETLKVPLEMEGPVKENGDINWGCPCMAGMVSGPCGFAFREAFSCFHASKDQPPSHEYPEGKTKGEECRDLFSAMSACMSQYPKVYGKGRDDDDDPFDLEEDKKDS